MPSFASLTFDDGPYADGTAGILEELGRGGILATFFVWGEQVEKHPELVRAALANGHSVQPHCWIHKPHPLMKPDEINADISAMLKLLEDLGAPAPRLWRPPWGLLQRATTQAIAREHGLELAGWSIDSSDYAGTTATTMLGEVRLSMDRLVGSDVPAVVLMHDCPLEPGQWSRRQHVKETTRLVRGLLSDSGQSFAPLTCGLPNGLEERDAQST